MLKFNTGINAEWSCFCMSKLRYRATLTDIQCSEERNLQPHILAALADGAWLSRAENILITGATGCGKSFLACALGHQTSATGHRTLYFNLNRLSEQIAIAKTDGTLIKWLNLHQRWLMQSLTASSQEHTESN